MTKPRFQKRADIQNTHKNSKKTARKKQSSKTRVFSKNVKKFKNIFLIVIWFSIVVPKKLVFLELQPRVNCIRVIKKELDQQPYHSGLSLCDNSNNNQQQ